MSEIEKKYVLMYYRVFQRKTWCFELLMWLGFWIIGLLIKLGVVLSSGNLCLINHLKLFWSQAASAASDDKCQNSKLFLLNFCPNFYQSIFLFWDHKAKNIPGMTADLIPSRFVWFHFSLWLCKFFLHFWKVNFCFFQQFFS